MRTYIRIITTLLLTGMIGACQTTPQTSLILSQKGAVELRAIQARAYDTVDRDLLLRAVLSTLQDLSYAIEKVDPASGTVTASKLTGLRLSATIYPQGQQRSIVRANALVIAPSIETQVDDPVFYQKFFFEPLSKNLFLAASTVESDADDDPSSSKQGT